MSINKTIIDFVKDFLHNRFKGYRTKIFAFALFVLSLYNYYTLFIFNLLCDHYLTFCDPKTAKWSCIYTAFICIIVYVSRELTDTAAGSITDFYKRFTDEYKNEVIKLSKK